MCSYSATIDKFSKRCYDIITKNRLHYLRRLCIWLNHVFSLKSAELLSTDSEEAFRILRNKSLTVQGGRAGQGYVVQAKSDDGWRNILGTASAI